jgi:hypothetical protein
MVHWTLNRKFKFKWCRRLMRQYFAAMHYADCLVNMRAKSTLKTPQCYNYTLLHLPVVE